MRVLDGDGFLVRIFLGESDQWQHTPLADATPRDQRTRFSLAREYSSKSLPACASSKTSSNSSGPCTMYISRARQPDGMFSMLK
jgi:hypothetical protein